MDKRSDEVLALNLSTCQEVKRKNIEGFRNRCYYIFLFFHLEDKIHHSLIAMKYFQRHAVISTLLFVFVLTVTSCSNSIYNEVRSNLSTYENGTVIVEPGAAIFIFNPESKSEWNWYQKSTPLNALEYGFAVQFELDGVSYECGYSLFKHPLARPDEGSFKELIHVGQIDLWKMEPASSGPIGGNRVAIMISGRPVEYVRMKTLVDKSALAIVLREKDIVSEFNRTRPDSILFKQIMPSEPPVRRSVKVTYRDSESMDN